MESMPVLVFLYNGRKIIWENPAVIYGEKNSSFILFLIFHIL